MYTTLLRIIPLDLAAILSPLLLTLTIFLLGSKKWPRLKAFFFLIGALVIGLGASFLGDQFGQFLDVEGGNINRSAIVDIIFGCVFLSFGFASLFFKARSAAAFAKFSVRSVWIWLPLGFILNFTNFDAIVLIITAAREIEKAGLDSFQRVLLLIINSIFYTLPVLFPLLVFLLLPHRAGRILGKVSSFMVSYSKYIALVLLTSFGLFFLIRGLSFFY